MKKQAPNYIPAILLIVAVIVITAICGFYAFRPQPEVIQGQAEVTEYRVSSKVPGRVKRILVEEGQQVHAGDTLAILKGAREEQKRGAYEMWQKAKAGREVMEKSYARVKRLHDEGVVTSQKLDEVTAQRDAAIATERAAKSQYDMAVNGAQIEDREAAAALTARAGGAIKEVKSYLKETVLVAALDGEVTDIFPSIGELVGTGAPVMNVALMNKLWVSFNVREDKLSTLRVGQEVEGFVPALGDKTVKLRIASLKDVGSYAVWRASKSTGQYDLKTFRVKATPTQSIEGLRPGMTVVLR